MHLPLHGLEASGTWNGLTTHIHSGLWLTQGSSDTHTTWWLNLTSRQLLSVQSRSSSGGGRDPREKAWEGGGQLAPPAPFVHQAECRPSHLSLRKAGSVLWCGRPWCCLNFDANSASSGGAALISDEPSPHSDWSNRG